MTFGKEMKTIALGFSLGGVAWMITTVLVLICFTLDKTPLLVASYAANWPLFIWNTIAPINETENAYFIGIGRNLVGWVSLGVASACCYLIIQNKKPNNKGCSGG